jgi:hypothetical protein
MQGRLREKVASLRGELEEASRALIEEIRNQTQEIIANNEEVLAKRMQSLGAELEKVEAWESRIQEQETDIEIVRQTIREVSQYTVQGEDVERMEVDDCFYIPQDLCKHVLFEQKREPSAQLKNLLTHFKDRGTIS